MIKRRKSKQIQIGNVKIGGDAPISVQSMCNTDTCDIEATLRQLNEFADRGCEIARLAVLNEDAACAIKDIVKKAPLPLVADIHFDYRLAIECLNNGIHALRLNPGNIGKRENVEKVVKLAKINQTPIRIGVNGGSLEKELLNVDMPLSEKMVQSAMRHIKILEDLDFDLIKVSLKSSDVMTTIDAYRSIAGKISYPLHLGITEAGTLRQGLIKSSIGLGTLLSEGIGDTVRVSLTEDPVNEIPVARYLADRYGGKLHSSMSGIEISGRKARACYAAPSRERLILDFACDFGKMLLDKKIDEVELHGSYIGENGKETGARRANRDCRACTPRPYDPGSACAVPWTGSACSERPAGRPGWPWSGGRDARGRCASRRYGRRSAGR